MVLNILIFLLAFAGMELSAWATHKYVMHGFLWSLHKSHHSARKGWFEWNDLFAIFFAGISIWLIYLGFPDNSWHLWAGLGIAAYGMAYFIMHDIVVHQRLKFFRNTRSGYFTAVRRAHKIHHSRLTKEDGQEFGFLYVRRKYFSKPKSTPDAQ